MSSRPVFDPQIQAQVTACGVIAVLVIDEVRDAVPLARAPANAREARIAIDQLRQR